MALATARLYSLQTRFRPTHLTRFRGLHTQPHPNVETKYADKLKQRAQEKGLSVAELKARVREEEHAKQRREAASKLPTTTPASPNFSPSSSNPAEKARPVPGVSVRKDSAPFKPLSSILNLPRLFSRPHTSVEISRLWTAYHTSRSGGTGKGYICASVPLELYEKMMAVSSKYPTFVVPVPRIKGEPREEGETDTAYEFYFLQWAFHGAPPPLSTVEDPFSASLKTSTVSNGPQISTVLFTPLQEYKMRSSFATPYLILTFYTDLASSHGTVLMRGEITPAAASVVTGASDLTGRHMLSQEDAQLLAMEVQKFYLWGEGAKEGKGREAERLLKVFHEQPEAFKWEELLRHAEISL